MFGWFKKTKRSELFTLVEASTKDLNKWELCNESVWSPSVKYVGNTPIIWELKKGLNYSSLDWEYPVVSPCCLQADEALLLGNLLFQQVWRPLLKQEKAARRAAETAFRNEIAGELYDSVLAVYTEQEVK